MTNTPRSYLIMMILTALTAVSFKKPTLKVVFTDKDWTAAKKQAKDESKFFFVDFDASYCAICRNMDESTYLDQNLADYMKTNVVAHRLDVQDFDGVMWSQQYEVETLPTMLIFNSSGKLVKRLEGYQSARDLLKIFNTLSTPTNRPNTVGSNTAAPAPTTVSNSNTANSGGFKPVTTAKPQTETPKPVTVVNTPAPPRKSGFGLYEFKARRKDNKGYAVQIGIYNDYPNVINDHERIERLSTASATFTTLVNVEEGNNGKTAYRVLVGIYNSETEAEAAKQQLKRKGIEGIVKNLTDLR